MIFDFLKKKCVCGMKEEKGKGIVEGGKWFCCKGCLEYHKKNKSRKNKRSCCG